MASGQQIVVTSRLKAATELINTINVQKFPFMLTRILQKLHLRNRRIFNDKEREQLCNLFTLSESDLETVLQACAYVYEQAAYHTIHPNNLNQAMLDAGMDDEHAQVIATVWSENATSFVAELKKHTMAGPQQLLGSEYQLHLTMGDSELTRLQEPKAIFDFRLGNPDASNAEDRETQSVPIEFSHAQLRDFFMQLEKVQEQLDTLS